MMIRCSYASPCGTVTIVSDGTAVTGLWFDGCKGFPKALPPVGTDAILRLASAWLDDYFAGLRPDPTRVSVHLAGTNFSRRVWDALTEIPYGETITYGTLAGQIGSRSAQAVGQAVGRNPVSILVPCHRVIGADGELTGYAAGVEKKAFLLRLEQGKVS